MAAALNHGHQGILFACRVAGEYVKQAGLDAVRLLRLPANRGKVCSPVAQVLQQVCLVACAPAGT